MYEEFDESDVLDLVQAALSDLGKDAFAIKSKLPLALGDSDILKSLSEVLSVYLNQADIQMILDELRRRTFKDFNVDKTLEQLHIITKNCIKCPNLIHGSQIPYWNVTDPDVVFIVEGPYVDQSSMELFTNTASGAGFSSSRICMTFVNRCQKKSKTKYTLDEINACTPYLHTEIQVLRPKLIVPLGLIATCAIMGASIQMNEQRGKLLWLGPWPILPMFSPGYALRGGDNLSSLFAQDMEKAHNFVYGEK